MVECETGDVALANRWKFRDSVVKAHRHEQVSVVHGLVGISFLLAIELDRLDRGRHFDAHEWFGYGGQTLLQVGRVECTVMSSPSMSMSSVSLA